VFTVIFDQVWQPDRWVFLCRKLAFFNLEFQLYLVFAVIVV